MMTNTMTTLGTSIARAAAVALGGMIERGPRYTGKLDADRPGMTLAQAAYQDCSANLADKAIARVLESACSAQIDMFSAAPVGYEAAVGCAFNHRGVEGVILAYDVDTYAEPMFIVRFESGRTGVLRPTELGALS